MSQFAPKAGSANGPRCDICGKTRNSKTKTRQIATWHKCRLCGLVYCPTHAVRLSKPGWNSGRGAFDSSRICQCGGLTEPIE